jgi:hypothetical protein
VAPINVNDVFRCSYRRPSSCRRTKWYSRSFSGSPSGCRPSPADRVVSSSGNFCPNLSRRHRHPSRPKEPPKVVFKPRIGGSVQSQPIPALHAHYAPHQTTDQTLRVQIRSDHRRPSFHEPTRAPRRICPFANALHALPRASMVIHALPRAGRSSHAPALSGSTSHALWNLLAREIHAPYQSPRAYWHVNCTHFVQPQALRVQHTRQAFFQATRFLQPQALRVLYTRQAFLITILLPRVSQRAATSALALPRVKLPKKKKKTDPDPIFSARSNGLEPDLPKWVRPSIGPRVSVF